jgi:hypothetical protein|tara:strand:- start:57 stop:200 length:144 start_codon:yes stop_codon:yes gene_type:complete
MLISDDILAEIPIQEFTMRIEDEKSRLNREQLQNVEHHHYDATVEEV